MAVPSLSDKEYYAQRNRLRKLATKWFPNLGLSWWSVDTVYSRVPLTKENEDGWACHAKASVKWEYGRATLTFNMLEIKDVSDEEVERTFVHECCHVLVNEMRMWGAENMSSEKLDEAYKHEERVVSAMTNAFLWTEKAATKAEARKKKRK